MSTGPVLLGLVAYMLCLHELLKKVFSLGKPLCKRKTFWSSWQTRAPQGLAKCLEFQTLLLFPWQIAFSAVWKLPRCTNKTIYLKKFSLT